MEEKIEVCSNCKIPMAKQQPKETGDPDWLCLECGEHIVVCTLDEAVEFMKK